MVPSLSPTATKMHIAGSTPQGLGDVFMEIDAT